MNYQHASQSVSILIMMILFVVLPFTIKLGQWFSIALQVMFQGQMEPDLPGNEDQPLTVGQACWDLNES